MEGELEERLSVMSKKKMTTIGPDSLYFVSIP